MPNLHLLPVIAENRCTGCGWCVAACPFHLLSLEVRLWRKSSTLNDPAACPGCRKCAQACPFDVITMCKSSVDVPSLLGSAGSTPPSLGASG